MTVESAAGAGAREEYRYPFEAYPTGWYLLVESGELECGKVLPLRYFGRDIVLYRTESGRPVLVDAHCPHMGAHLGYGGKVCGENIRCPFHSWEFAADGPCVSVPYRTTERIPEVGLKTWRVRETSGFIFAHYSPTGDEPAWSVPDEPAWKEKGWIGYEKFSWRAKVHVQEIAENIPDTAHFVYVHDVPVLPKVRGKIDGHIYRQSMTNLVRGKEVTVLEHDAHGLGVSWIEAFIPVHYRMIVTATPIDALYTDLRIYFLVHEGEGAETLSQLSRDTIDLVIENTSRDVRIWEHKAYVERPPLVQGDGPISVLRRWSRQFYSA
jgi:nitrite reductase/ring-hydroxylating ferredoxin subunit